MSHLRPVILFLALLLSGVVVADPVLPRERAEFHIYLLMGQSNMVGRDTRGINKQAAPDPRILSLDPAGKWTVAKDPLHHDPRIPAGVGPGLGFAREMAAADPRVTIGLVPCAVGGTPLKRWEKSGDLYQQALARARTAARDGVIAGVLWHQGEADSIAEKDAASYGPRLARMIADLRADLTSPRLPFVAGELGDFLARDSKKCPLAPQVMAALRELPAKVPHSALADAAGLGHTGDHLHFSADAARVLGQRYARAMQSLRDDDSAAAVLLWPAGRMPGKAAREPERPHAPERTDATRITQVSRPTLTLYPAAAKNAPALIVCPGGGYSYVVMDKEGSDVASWLNSQGITALVLKYRNPQNRDGALQDLQRALRVARSRAAEWHIDPQRLGVIGFSAGGHLAARASNRFATAAYPEIDAIDRQSCRPDFAVLVYPAYLDDGSGGLSLDLDPAADIPPTLIVHSNDDRAFVPGSRLYAAALEKAGRPHRFLLYPSGGHGYGLHSDRDARAWPQDMLGWLKSQRLMK
jgi:acetyl esterase/lipase